MESGWGRGNYINGASRQIEKQELAGCLRFNFKKLLFGYGKAVACVDIAPIHRQIAFYDLEPSEPVGSHADFQFLARAELSDVQADVLIDLNGAVN